MKQFQLYGWLIWMLAGANALAAPGVDSARLAVLENSLDQYVARWTPGRGRTVRVEAWRNCVTQGIWLARPRAIYSYEYSQFASHCLPDQGVYECCDYVAAGTGRIANLGSAE